MKGTRFEFEEVSAILPFAATRPIELAGFGKGEKVLLPTLNSPPRIVLFDSIQDTQVNAILITAWEFANFSCFTLCSFLRIWLPLFEPCITFK